MTTLTTINCHHHQVRYNIDGVFFIFIYSSTLGFTTSLLQLQQMSGFVFFLSEIYQNQNKTWK